MVGKRILMATKDSREVEWPFFSFSRSDRAKCLMFVLIYT
jgi:hypothetical protein